MYTILSSRIIIINDLVGDAGCRSSVGGARDMPHQLPLPRLGHSDMENQ